MDIVAFIHIKKTAGKAMKHQLRRAFGTEHCDVKRWRDDAHYFSAADLHRLLWLYPRLRSIAGHSIKAYSDLRIKFPRLSYYTFLRDPIQRSISHYQYRVNLGTIKCTFEDWISDESNHNWQVRALAGTADLDQALRMVEHDISFTGLQERMDESLLMLNRALNLNRLTRAPSERVNAARNRVVRDEIIKDTLNLRLLRRANRLDIELYRYAEAVVFPRQQQAYASALARPARVGGRRFWARYGQGYCANVTYRELVYKPMVWLSRRRTRLFT